MDNDPNPGTTQQPGILGMLRTTLTGQTPPTTAELAEQERITRLSKLQLEQLESQARIDILRAEAAQRRQLHTDKAYYHLLEAMWGKKLDATWQAYAVNCLRDYMDSNNIRDPEERVSIINTAIKRYVDQLATEHRLGLHDILNIRSHNDNIKGVYDETIWWNPFTWHRKIDVSENSIGPSHEHRLYSLSQIIAVGSLVGISILGVGYVTRRLFSTLGDTTITPKIPPPPTPHTSTDIDHNLLTNTTKALSDRLTNISKDLSDIRVLGRQLSSYAPLRMDPSDGFMSRLSRGFNRLGSTIVEWSHSLKSRS